MQAEAARLGQWCWAIELFAHPLPEGLEDRTPVRVIRPGRPGSAEAHRVVDEQGREWDLERVNTDAGYSLRLGGRRVYEGAEEFGEHLFRAIFRLRAAPPGSYGDECARARMLDHWRWLLERNGWDPDAPWHETCRMPSPLDQLAG